MIIDLRDIRLADLDRVGGKAANLGELVAAGLPVPGGFCVPAAIYRDAIAGSWKLVSAALASDDAAEARRLVTGLEFPAGLAEAVGTALADLGDGPVAVRSSATAEDLAEASFAGQQETYLGVVGAAAVLAGVRACWGSLWTPRSIAYRERSGFDHAHVDLAVVVQRMVAAEVAGVAFTADPVTGRPGEIAIDASWGLGESVVSGAVTPDAFQVRDRQIVSRTLGAKQTRTDMAASGQTQTRETTSSEREQLCLTDAQVLAVAELAEQVRTHYGREMDIEWALADGTIWLLQARPITTPVITDTFQEPDQRGRASRLGRWLHDDILEHFPAPYPLDVVVVDLGARQLLQAFALAGLRVIAPGGLIVMDPDGIARVAYPKVRAWGVPGGLWRLMRTKPIDPRTWGAGPGRRVDEDIAALAAIDIANVPDTALADRFNEIWAAAERMLEARFGEYLPYQVVWGAQLDALLRLAGRRELTQYDLLTDLDFATVVIDRGLRELAADAATQPAVREALSERPIDVAAVRSADAQWWTQIERFLAAHGARTTGLYVPFANLSWREDLPGFLATVAALLRAEPMASGQSHAELVAEITGRLPRFLRGRFARLVADYRAGHVVREHSVTQMEELALLARATAREAERRMIGVGALPAAGDVKFLTNDELLGWLRGDATVDLAAVVRRRRQARPLAEATWWGASGDQAVGEFEDAGVLLSGAAGSPGRVSGPVRIITNPEQFPDLAPGDVLVCRFTDPSWTPLFSLAAAVIADTGGRLSHAAIVAREYGIPAVLGVGAATTALRDGQQVTVDGSRGLVLDASAGVG